MKNKAEKPKRQYQEVGLMLYEELKQACFTLGDRLPAERDMADRLKVSRAVIREALIMLELMEIVEIRKGSGIYLVKKPANKTYGHTFESSFNKDDAGPFELMQARQLLESHVAEFAATQATKKDIIKMRNALKLEKDNIATHKPQHDGDKLFHLAIAEATQNSVLVDLVKNLWERRENSPMWKQLHSHITDQTYREKWLIDHENILSFIQQRNPDAARTAMWRHLENVKDTLFALSEHQDPNFDGYIFMSNPVKDQIN